METIWQSERDVIKFLAFQNLKYNIEIISVFQTQGDATHSSIIRSIYHEVKSHVKVIREINR